MNKDGILLYLAGYSPTSNLPVPPSAAKTVGAFLKEKRKKRAGFAISSPPPTVLVQISGSLLLAP